MFSTTKATTSAFQTSPKNHATVTQYNLTTLMDHSQKSPSTTSVISIPCPNCKLNIKYNVANLPRQNGEQHL